MSEAQGKRWTFTINNPNAEDEALLVGTPADGPQANFGEIQYMIFQEERGENGTLHWQGFLILKRKQKLRWLKRNINPRAHWEIARGTNQQAADYCRKPETYTGGIRKEFGEMPARAEPKKKEERFADACEELSIVKEGYKRPRDITEASLLQPCFISAYKELTRDILGPYRPQLEILCLVGPPCSGKSFAIQKHMPEHGRAIYGNNGVWFQNPTADIMIFEEFCGQIPLTRMLQLLDPYPLSLEVKGAMAPCLYTKVVITSNTPPHLWYKTDEAGTDQRRSDAVKALFDRLGYDWGDFQHNRQCGHYVDCPPVADSIGMPVHEYLIQCREIFDTACDKFANHHDEDDH